MLSPPIRKPTTTSIPPVPSLQRKRACDASQARNDRPGLALGPSNGPLEREADRVADRVTAAGTPADFATVPATVQRRTSAAAPAAVDVPESVHRTLATPGRALDGPVRQEMEARFGQDFSQVRVHQGSMAERSALEVGALAYTAGRHVVFGAGRFAPAAPAGRHLLAHELAHVVQQAGGAATQVVQRQPLGGEQEAAPFPMESFRQSLTLDGFDSGQAALKPDHQAKLAAYKQRLQMLLGRYPDTFITVIGHTDATDTAEHNQALGEQRAEAVAAELTSGDFPLPAAAVSASSLGETALSVETRGADARNRRVEIIPTLRRSFKPAPTPRLGPQPEGPVDVWGPGFEPKGPRPKGPFDLPEDFADTASPQSKKGDLPEGALSPTPPPIKGPAAKNKIREMVRRIPVIKSLPDWAQGGIANAMEGGAWDGVEAAVDEAPVSGAVKQVIKAALKGVFDKIVKD